MKRMSGSSQKTTIFPVPSEASSAHIPLAAGMIQAYASHYRNGALLEDYTFAPMIDCATAAATQIGRAFGPGVWLFSNYMWSADQTMEISEQIKRIDPRNITIHGGPNTPMYPRACETFLQQNRHVDIAVRGEGEITTSTLLDHLRSHWKDGTDWKAGLETVEGIAYLDASDNIVRTPDRARVQELDELPSPYATKVFKEKPYLAAILETNRGCPYRCTYCDWGSLTAQKIKLFHMDRVQSELEWIAQHRIPILWIADANFGIFPRDVEISEKIVEAKKKHGFPKEVVLSYAKNTTEHLAKIVRLLCQAEITCQGIISIQTADQQTLDIVRRSNIRTEHYNKLTKVFRDEGLPLSTDLMIGLPGATTLSFRADLQRVFDDNIFAQAYPTRLLPNSPMADPAYRKEYQIRINKNRFLVSTFSYDEDDMAEMTDTWTLYEFCENFSMLRYVLRYLQWDHNIPALDFIRTLRTSLRESSGIFQSFGLRAYTKLRPLPYDLMLAHNGSWSRFYNEIAEWTHRTFDIPQDSAFEAVFQANEAVIPYQGRILPETIPLRHDVAAYIQQGLDLDSESPTPLPLSSYPPGELEIIDPEGRCRQDLKTLRQYTDGQTFWELQNTIRRPQSRAHFVEI